MPGTTALTLLVVAQLSVAASPAATPMPRDATTPGTETLKERLSDKASDEQRVDNCHVAPERRGDKKRPDCAVSKEQPTRGTSARADR